MKLTSPVSWLKGHVPKNSAQLEIEFKNLVKLVFWILILAPVVIIPAYYLLVALGILPPISLPA